MACGSLQQPTMSLAVNTAVAESKNMLQSTQQKLRILWDESMNNPSRSVRHEQTSVLLISWDQTEDDLKVGQEVSRLQHTFEKTYGFKVTTAQLSKHRASKQALAKVSNFVLEEDNPRSLLIIYYAGHGFGTQDVVPGDIGLAPSAPKLGDEIKLNEQETKKMLVWSKVEPAISQAEDADVLLIFDCCNAGRLCRPYNRSAHPPTHYQVLAACSEDQVTRGPGKESFTSALIWALDKLSNEKDPFSISKLRSKIMDCPEFPKEQIPALSDRESRETSGDIVICRKGLAPGPPIPIPTKPENDSSYDRAYLELRFVFDGVMSDEKVKETAEELKRFREGDAGKKLDLARISFQSRYTAVEYAAMRFKAALEAGNKKQSPAIASVGASLVQDAFNEHAQIKAHQVQIDVNLEAEHQRIDTLENKIISQEQESGLQNERRSGKRRYSGEEGFSAKRSRRIDSPIDVEPSGSGTRHD